MSKRSSINKAYVLEQILSLNRKASELNEDALIERYLLLCSVKQCSGCFLWDISTKPELAQFLYQNHFLAIACNILTDEHTYRLKVKWLKYLSNSRRKSCWVSSPTSPVFQRLPEHSQHTTNCANWHFILCTQMTLAS